MNQLKAGDTLYHLESKWQYGKRVTELMPRVIASVGRKWIKFHDSWVGRVDVTTLRCEAFSSQWYRSVDEYEEACALHDLRRSVVAACDSEHRLRHLSKDQLQTVLKIVTTQKGKENPHG